MKDRIPKYAGRVKLVPVPNQPNIYDMERADEPLQEGTPLNKNTLLSDQTVSELGLSEDATPDEAIRLFNKKINDFQDDLTQDFEEFLKSSYKIARGSYVGTGEGGQENPNVLTFDRPVKMLIIVKHGEYAPSNNNITGDIRRSYYDYSSNTPLVLFGTEFEPKVHGDQAVTPKLLVTQFNETVSWYVQGADDTPSYEVARMQRNVEGDTYEYIAFTQGDEP